MGRRPLSPQDRRRARSRAPRSSPDALDRRVIIRAPQDVVFRYFTDSARWATWWGAGSTIDPKPGGRMSIVYPNGVKASGEVVEIDPPNRIAFTFGYESGTPMAPGASLVTITLTSHGNETRLDLTHDFADAVARDEHIQGWRYQLSVFANVIANDLHAKAVDAIDAWFTAWSDPDAATRATSFARIAISEVEFRDQYSALAGIEDLVAHGGATQRFMPNVRLERMGDVRHCQGMVLADWKAMTNGAAVSEGTNFFVLAPNGRIEWVTGF
ncbi:MAG TPA: SRPBCC family protein [Gemmatimonadaceae bacterium]